VSRLKDKPFVILWISLDDTRETVTETTGKEKLPGIQTWDESARENPVAERYNIHSLPTWYVLDEKGTIVARDPFEEKLIPAIEGALHTGKAGTASGD